MLSFYSRTKAGKRSINKRLNKTEPIAKEKSDICRKNMSYSYETTAAPLSILPSKRQEEPSSYSHVAGSGSKQKGRKWQCCPTWVIPDRQAIPVSDMKYFHFFLPYSSASSSGAIILVPWLALVWGDETHCSSMAPLNAPSSSLATVDLI